MHSRRCLLAAILPAAALTLVGFSAQAQNYYTTNFSSADTGLSASDSTYSSPNTPTDPLAGQNGWASNDDTVTAGTGTRQIVGNSNFVGQYGQYFGGGTNFAAVTGGVYRVSNPSAAAPDVVPSATNAPGGINSLYHPITFTPGPGLALNLDFVITAPNATGQGFTTRDAFAFTLGNATTNLLTLSFTQATTLGDPATNDGLTIITGANNLGQGGTSTVTGNGVVLNGQYHLSLTVTNLATGAFTLILQGSTVFTTTGTAGAFTAASLTKFGTLWNL